MYEASRPRLRYGCRPVGPTAYREQQVRQVVRLSCSTEWNSCGWVILMLLAIRSTLEKAFLPHLSLSLSKDTGRMKSRSAQRHELGGFADDSMV
ncbi:hypothetical protein K461DRAFT_122892 [Myriangium duriaei CBS 260.36]|uniref:Uncharacterized protein n=1 Tax=Myriangium duriaei CBS 260.36 TaxID=1168546 RepID=A0A9P4MLE4_9PEZI|nr:hypothetical protein K461DRAFT_122892 [Myriangium duriaei CBS 260.36]